MARYRRARRAAWWHGRKKKRAGRVVLERIPRDPAGDPGPVLNVEPKEPA
jgi:hypothetical protein